MNHQNGTAKIALHNRVQGDGIPFDDGAEKAVLGSLLLEPDAYGHVRPFVDPDDFYLQRHRWIFEELCALIESGQSPDILTLYDRLTRKEQEPDGGWVPYLEQLVNYVPETSNAGEYAKIVQEYAIRRRMIVTGRTMATAAADVSTPLEQVISQSETATLNIRGRNADLGVKTAEEMANEYLARFDDLSEREGYIPGLPTGYKDLDRVLIGFEVQPYLIAARPGMGKSSLMLGMCLDLALKQRKRVGIFSLEMSAVQLMNRAVSHITGIPLELIRIPNRLGQEQRLYVRRAINMIRRSPLFVDCTPGLSPSQIRARALRQKMMGGLDFVAIDHLHIMSPDTPGLTGTALATHLSKSLMMLPKLLECPVVYLAQLSRALELRQDKRPTLSDLRDSGSLEEDAYGVLFIYREEYYDPMSEAVGQAEVIVAKNRDGETGRVVLVWRGETTSFLPLAYGGKK